MWHTSVIDGFQCLPLTQHHCITILQSKIVTLNLDYGYPKRGYRASNAHCPSTARATMSDPTPPCLAVESRFSRNFTSVARPLSAPVQVYVLSSPLFSILPYFNSIVGGLFLHPTECRREVVLSTEEDVMITSGLV